MIDNNESNPISIMLIVILSVIMMSFVLLVAGVIINKNLLVFEEIIEPNLGAWGTSMYQNIVTDMAHWVFIIPGFFILVVLVWGIKTVIKKNTYDRVEDEFLNGDL